MIRFLPFSNIHIMNYIKKLDFIHSPFIGMQKDAS